MVALNILKYYSVLYPIITSMCLKKCIIIIIIIIIVIIIIILHYIIILNFLNQYLLGDMVCVCVCAPSVCTPII